MQRFTALFLLLAYTVLQANPHVPTVSYLDWYDYAAPINTLIDLPTGQPILSQSDYTTSGTEPLSNYRSFGLIKQGDWRYSWSFPEPHILVHVTRKRRHIEISICEPNGQVISCEKSYDWFHDKGRSGTWTTKGCVGEWSNTATGTLSGHTDPEQIQLKHYVEEGISKIAYTDGSGERRTYICFDPLSFSRSKKSGSFDRYVLSEVIKASGNRIHYEYDEDHKRAAIKAKNSTDTQCMGWLQFDYEHDDIGPTACTISTSDQQAVTYQFETQTPKDGRYRMTSLLRRNLTSVKTPFFTQDFSINLQKRAGFPFRIDSTSWSRERRLHFEYNELGQVRALYGTDNPKRDRTTSLARIYYTPKPCTPIRTLNCGRHDFSYIYTRANRPYCLAAAKAVKEYYLWNDALPHQLAAKTLTDAHRNVHIARLFSYDERGNVVEETLAGDLTGKATERPIMKKALMPDGSEQVFVRGESDDKKPADGRFTRVNCAETETHTVSRRYSEDGFNLLVEEVDGPLRTTYTYRPNTNLLTRKLTYAGETITFREFFQYDDCAIEIAHISDDGSGLHADDLTNVTVRSIRRTTPRYALPAFGVPQEMQELYWDTTTQQEVLVSVLSYAFNEQGQVSAKTVFDPSSNTSHRWEYLYDEWGFISQECSPEGAITHNTFNRFGQLCATSVEGVEGETVFEYDSLGQTISKRVQTPTQQREWHYTYDGIGNVLTETNPQGHTRTFAYDNLSRRTEQVALPTRCGRGIWHAQKTVYAHDPLGNITKEEQVDGPCTHYTYNIRNQPLTTTYPNGAQESYQYDHAGHMVCSRSRSGAQTLYCRDAHGNALEEVTFDPQGNELTRTIRRFKGTLCIEEIDPAGVRSTYRYDGASRLVEETRGMRRVTYAYDAFGNQTAKTYHHEAGYRSEQARYDAQGRAIETWTEDETGRRILHTLTEYDPLGRPIKETRIDRDTTTETTRTYNYFGEATTETCGDEGITITYDHHYEIDGLSCLQRTTTDALGQQLIEVLDPAGNLICQHHLTATNEVLSVTEHFYDGRGHCIGRIDHREQGEITTQWTYNKHGQLTALIEGNGTRTTTYLYDKTGELCATIRPDGTKICSVYDCLKQRTQHRGPDFCYDYLYDSLGRITQVTDHYGQISSFTYDDNGKVLQERQANGLTKQFTYDQLGRLLQATLPDGTTICYEWDSRFLRALSSGGFTHHYDHYDGRGALLEATLGSGSHLRYTFDDHYRCIGVDHPHFSSRATYDPTGNLCALSTTDPTGHIQSTFTYDARGQLTSETGVATHHYTYDPLGNRLVTDDDPATFDALNQQIEPGTKWDAHGCLTEEDDTSYLYDSLDRLIRIETELIALTFSYDYRHRCQSRTLLSRIATTAPWTQLATLQYLYQGDTEIGSVAIDGELVELRILGRGFGGEIGSAVAIRLDQETYFPLHDHRGSIVVLLNTAGDPVEHYRYEAFGAHHIHSQEATHTYSPLGNPWRFVSKRQDEVSGLINFGRRYYNPIKGRWTTPDPLGYNDGPNRYIYAHNSPLTKVDFRGYNAEVLANFSSDQLMMPYADFAAPLDVPFIVETQTVFAWATSDCTPQWQSGIGDLTHLGRTDTDGVLYTAMNGVFNEPSGVRQLATTVSDKFGGHNVYYVYNATHGLADIGEATVNMTGVATHPARRLADLWIGLAEQNPTDLIFHTAHSQACAIANNSLDLVPQSVRDRLAILAVGPCQLIKDHKCRDCLQLVSTRDPIFWMQHTLAFCSQIGANFIGLEHENQITKCNSLVYLEPHPDAPFFDHPFHSPTYQMGIEKHGLDWAQKRGLLK